MIEIKYDLDPSGLSTKIKRFWDLSAQKIRLIETEFEPALGSPVVTVQGKYTSRSWTEWTQGFQYGSMVLQYDATGDEFFLDEAQQRIVEKMAAHVSDFGVHDHGFNNVSTYGNLRRLILEERIPFKQDRLNFYELALKISGAVQARRWTPLRDGGGFIYSFNGPHSLFVDTIRSCRSLSLAHLLDHRLADEAGNSVSLLSRMVQHALATAEYSVYYGEGRDSYDIRGRTAHESIFNVENGVYRCPGTQQGYSPFSTWTRGLAWAMSGFAEELEFLEVLADDALAAFGGRNAVQKKMLNAATATCDFYLEQTPSDGIPYWDTGAPELRKLDSYLESPADPYNSYEPVDSSAAAIGAQGLLRLGHYLQEKGQEEAGRKYFQAGLTLLDRLLEEPYLSTKEQHQGLILHSVYHRPNGWDYTPEGQQVPCGESSMWGDYHAREAVLYVQRLMENQPYLTFFGPVE